MPRPYDGLLTALVTPFQADGHVDEEAAVALARHLLENGSDGFVIAGTTGEATTLTEAEHLGLVELMVAEVGADGPIVAGAGSNDTRHAVEQTEQMAQAGVDAILSVTGYYNRPSLRGIRRHYEEVARAAGGVPVIVYNIPSRTTINLPPEFLAGLAEIEGIEGLKQSNHDELQPIDGLAVFAGNDTSLARALDLGCAGGICVASHVAGPQMKRMFGASSEERAAIDAELRDLFDVLFITNSPAPTKAALALLGHDVGGVRLPLAECDEDELRAVREVLAAHGLLEKAPAS
ncbi:MAG TPA: 4-hydroxy-tetrahydrodipicolinate synthase [Solirubrobacteraceae bacterium]|jgi:4-hydroxy-tetrahydrodipicolinate synthase